MEASAESDITTPDIAVVIPTHRQSGLLPEAVESVLSQQGTRRVAAVIVDDGCPFSETCETGLRLARGNPGRVHYLRRANGGLGAARNTGVDFALQAWPGCRAVFLLDADNRLRPHVVEKAAALLEESGAGTGWVYPDFDFFGAEEHYSAAGEHSVFLHLLENTSDAGSLVSRAVFEAGLRFDETMCPGFEDWDFRLRAAAAGFRGRHLPMAGFRYRRRADGMRLSPERQRPVIPGGMRARSAQLLRPRRLLALEAAEVPRFLLHRSGAATAEAVLDPLRPRRAPMPREASRRALVEAARHPQAVHAPPFAVFASDVALDALGRGKLLHNLFWQAEILLRQADAVAITIAAGDDGVMSLARDARQAMPEDAPLLILRTAALQEAASLGADWPAASTRTATLRATLPAGILAASTTLPPVLQDAQAEFEALSDSFATRHPEHGEWRGDWRRPRSKAHEGYRELIGAGAVLPWLGEEDGRDIALMVPVFELGGIERVIANYACVLRTRGWRPHLFVSGAERAALPAGALAAFETVQFPVAGGIEGGDPNRTSPGAPLSGFGEARDIRDAVGQAAPMHALLATHALGGHAIAGALRELGVLCIAGLHMVERDRAGAPLANPQAFLAHEASYDGVAVVSGQLRDWCLGHGVPAAKVIFAPNGPGHDSAPQKIAAALEERRGREGKLRALFLGRPDPQKGLDRLQDIVALTPDVEWRIVGRAVLGLGPPEPPGMPVEPPPADSAALDALYAWADVLVLRSRLEGAPLTVLEAQRFGCVPIATATGALPELVAEGLDGFLIPGNGDAAVAGAIASCLAALAADRPALLAAAEAAAARAAALPGWEARMSDLLACLDEGPAP
jgi:glycosyltransferase involved in cell wall biosynthesis